MLEFCTGSETLRIILWILFYWTGLGAAFASLVRKPKSPAEGLIYILLGGPAIWTVALVLQLKGELCYWE